MELVRESRLSLLFHYQNSVIAIDVKLQHYVVWPRSITKAETTRDIVASKVEEHVFVKRCSWLRWFL